METCGGKNGNGANFSLFWECDAKGILPKKAEVIISGALFLWFVCLRRARRIKFLKQPSFNSARFFLDEQKEMHIKRDVLLRHHHCGNISKGFFPNKFSSFRAENYDSYDNPPVSPGVIKIWLFQSLLKVLLYIQPVS